MAIRLRLPVDEALSPVDDRLAELTLVTWDEENGRSVETRDVVDRSAGLDLGLLPAGHSVRFAVELRSPTQRLIGYGQTSSPIDIEAGAELEVQIHVRRPLVYLAGASTNLEIYDATLDATTDYAAALAIAAPRAVAPTADGTTLVVVGVAGVAGSLQLLSTSDHRPLGDPVALARPPRDVAVTPDGRWAIVGHDGAGGGVSVVDLAELQAGRTEPVFVPLGNVGAVAAADRDGVPAGHALLDRSATCDGAEPASAVVELELGQAPTERRRATLDGPLGDFAQTEAGALWVADPCGDQLAELSLDDGVLATRIELPAASTVATVADRVWGAGVAPATATLARRVVLVSASTQATEETRLELAPAQERIESTEFSGSDQKVEVAIDADTLAAIDLAVLPGSELVALTTRGYYHADESGDFNGNPVVPEMEITTHEYVLIDGTNRSVVHRVRTFCDGFLLSDAVLTEFVCSTAPDQDALPFAASFEPSQISVLYGGR